MYTLTCTDDLLLLNKLLQNCVVSNNNKPLLCQTILGEARIGEQLTEVVAVLVSLKWL